MIRHPLQTLVILLIVFCLAAACAIWFATPPQTSSPSIDTASQERPSPKQLPPGAEAEQAAASHIVPDRRFTPGVINPDVTQDNIDSTICVPGYTKSVRPPARYTSRLKREQLDDPARGYEDREMRDY